MISVAKIREQYPEPKSSRDTYIGYCVGGAFILYTDDYKRSMMLTSTRFPTAGSLAEALMREVNCLGYEEALRAAMKITTLNDARRFEEAWKALEEALQS